MQINSGEGGGAGGGEDGKNEEQGEEDEEVEGSGFYLRKSRTRAAGHRPLDTVTRCSGATRCAAASLIASASRRKDDVSDGRLDGGQGEK